MSLDFLGSSAVESQPANQEAPIQCLVWVSPMRYRALCATAAEPCFRACERQLSSPRATATEAWEPWSLCSTQ